ncbi:TlpA disulfide reductase family protein [Flavobacterium sp. LHD-80]|uniref:TlpA disulfide reductase family protein n=1 Tax=Flavobacterium sp. LHD-80 TaxID=3071411 RepID=UPI0027E1025C|nr:TlpA disulfide reductase family protein [Flavobacterium sp. LHD-80]MDQ6473026.1 TlpA disulfide reductase family protein [Flavobacterium sp. LHD-80]
MRLTTSILLIFFCVPLVAQHKFSISGTIPAQYKGAEIMLSSNNSSFSPISVKEKNGKFYLSGEIKQDYEPANFSVQKDNKYVGNFFILIGAQDMKINIVKLNMKDFLNDFQSFNIPFNEEQKEYRRLTRPSADSAKATFDIYYDARSKHLELAKQDSLWNIISDWREKLLIQRIKFVESHPDAYISLYLFNKEIVNGNHPVSAERLDATYNKLSNNLKESDLGKSVGQYINKRLSLTVGHVLPNFSFSTDKGEHFELPSSFKNKKLILLCFWSKGCAPCIRKIPTLKVINEKYKSKGLQLISISTDAKSDIWFDSLNKYQMPWLQTCDLPAYVQGDRIQSLLNVVSFPQYFLIDATGKLVYQNEQLNDDEDLTMLQKLLESQLQ